MFKSIEYRLILNLLLLTAAVAAVTWCASREEWLLGGIAFVVGLYALLRMVAAHRKYNDNIVFLLNALENGDYTFHFSERRLARRERELNRMMNRIRDLLERTRHEIIENERFLGVIIENVATGIIVFDRRRVVRKTNSAALAMLGLPVLTHLQRLSAIDEQLPERLAAMNDGGSAQITIANEREEKRVSIRMSHLTIAGEALNILTLNNIGNELAAAEMDSWIRLIRVMTHEIMNSIAPISSLSETMLTALRDETLNDETALRENTVEAFRTIQATAQGLLNFVASYRQFTGIPKPAPVTLPVKQLVDEAIHLQSAEIERRGIKIIRNVAPDSTLIADKAQIMQVLTNLLKNALEAFAEGQRDAAIAVTAKQIGSNFLLEIANNGAPIPTEVASQIFVPFFTTKTSGTGIGLSLSRYIMRLHGGNLRYRYENGKTVFCMEFEG